MIVLIIFILVCLLAVYSSMSFMKRSFLQRGIIDAQQAQRVDLVIRHMCSYVLLGSSGLILLARDLLTPLFVVIWLGALVAYSIYAMTTYISMFRDIVATRKRKRQTADVLADYRQATETETPDQIVRMMPDAQPELKRNH